MQAFKTELFNRKKKLEWTKLKLQSYNKEY
jgi:hypothetical protein